VRSTPHTDRIVESENARTGSPPSVAAGFVLARMASSTFEMNAVPGAPASRRLSLPAQSPVSSSPASQPEIMERARRRLNELEEEIAEGMDDDEPHQPLRPEAVRAALSVIRNLAADALIARVGIFPTPEGGLNYRRSVHRQSVTLEMPPDPASGMRGQYAGRDLYRNEIVGDVVAAAHFISRATK
jgi:hypothetical protein